MNDDKANNTNYFLFIFFLIIPFSSKADFSESNINLSSTNFQNPTFSVPVFNEPQGSSLGIIIFGKESRKSAHFDEFKISFFEKERADEDIFFVALVRNEPVILFNENQDNYIRIIGYDEEFWIRTEDLDRLGVKYTSLDDFLANDLKKGIILYPGEISLVLRSGSGDGFRKIIDLYGNDYKMKYLGFRSGNWLKVTVFKYNKDNCINQLDDLMYKIDGWIPVKNKNGEFLFHLNPNPCN
jgi:hypothetical protein